PQDARIRSLAARPLAWPGLGRRRTGPKYGLAAARAEGALAPSRCSRRAAPLGTLRSLGRRSGDVVAGGIAAAMTTPCSSHESKARVREQLVAHARGLVMAIALGANMLGCAASSSQADDVAGKGGVTSKTERAEPSVAGAEELSGIDSAAAPGTEVGPDVDGGV